MIISRSGREYAHFSYTADTDPTGLVATVGLGGVWYAATFTVLAPSPPLQPYWTGVVTLLVAGPDATANPTGTAVLVLGANRAAIRFPDVPEIVVREAGVIVVVD